MQCCSVDACSVTGAAWEEAVAAALRVVNEAVAESGVPGPRICYPCYIPGSRTRLNSLLPLLHTLAVAVAVTVTLDFAVSVTPTLVSSCRFNAARAGKDVLIAGALPPLHGSYNAEGVGEEADIRKVYAEHVALMKVPGSGSFDPRVASIGSVC